MAGTSSRGNPSMGDVLRSVLVLGGIVLVVWFAAQVFTVTPDRAAEGKDLDQTVAASRAAVTEFDLLAPKELPDGWLVTSARPEPQSWALNVLTADDDYIGLEQSLETEQDLIDGREADFTRSGATEIDGQKWVTWEAGSEVAYTRTDGDVAALVIGAAPKDEVEDYLASLSSESGASESGSSESGSSESG